MKIKQFAIIFCCLVAFNGGAAYATSIAQKPLNIVRGLIDDKIHTLSANQIVTMVKSNQIIFRNTNNQIDMICRCGVKVAPYMMAKSLRNAVIAIEDKRFISHRGLDPNGILRAVVKYVMALGRKRIEGGSTITQQLIKLTVLSPERLISRKMTEADLAIKLETKMEKINILAAYLNQAVFAFKAGRPIVGVENASRLFFGRSALELNLFESAVLAGMLKAPSKYNILINPKRSKARAATVLKAMLEQGYITNSDLITALKPNRKRGNLKPYQVETRSFMHWVVAQIKQIHPELTLKPGLRIPITLEFETQAKAAQALEKSMSGKKFKSVNAGYVLIDYQGRVLSLLGQRNFANSQYNFVTQAQRQPASTFKAFVYGAALESGSTKYSKKLAHALAISDNKTAISLGKKTGISNVINFAHKMGIQSQLHNRPELALGTSEVNLLELTKAYMPFADGGLSAKVHGYHGVINGNAVELWYQPQTNRVLSKETAATMRKLLMGVVENGTAKPAKILTTAGGKTGTSDAYRNALFVGFNRHHVSGIWLGKANNKPMKRINGQVASGIWANIEYALPR